MNCGQHREEVLVRCAAGGEDSVGGRADLLYDGGGGGDGCRYLEVLGLDYRCYWSNEAILPVPLHS